jgi:sulfonate transport system substrate-binding protein
MTMFGRIGVVAAAAMLAASLIAGRARAEPVTIRVDWNVIPGQFGPLIPTVPKYDANVYRHYGKSYVVEPLHLQGGGATLTALATGETDVSTLSPLTLVLGATQAKLDIRVIGEELTTELPGYFQTQYWARGDEVKTIDDLKGKIFGVNALGSNVDAAARIVMARHGFAPDRDFRLVEIPFPAMVPALKERKVDVAPLVPPFSFMAEKDPALKPVFSVGDAFGPVETLMFMTTERFIAKNRAALVDFLEDNMRMRAWMTDPKTRMEAVKQLSDTSKLPVDAYASWVYTHRDYYYDPHAMVDVARLQKNVDDMKKAGIIPASIDVAPYVDLSLAKEAAARLAER